MRGRFITFEGVEGVGKSTQIAHAADYLRSRGIEPLVTREPGGTPIAEKLRALVLEPQHGAVGATEELLIMFAARASHVADVIRPALRRGRWVLCDRFTDATEAYQGGGRGMSLAIIRQLARIAHPRLTPDLTFVFDAPASVANARVSGRGTGQDRIEAEDDGVLRAGAPGLSRDRGARSRVACASSMRPGPNRRSRSPCRGHSTP